MIQVRDAVPQDAGAIADLLGELGYPVSAAEMPARLSAVADVPGRVRQAAASGCETLELTSRDDRHRTHRFYVGLGFESGSRKFVRPVAV
jgi:hypothetical protein